MKLGQKLWSRDELILAINLYCKLPFSKMDSRNSEIIYLANLLGRTPSAIAMKLVNFASLDPTLHQKGMTNSSKLDRMVWDEFFNNWDVAILESESLLAQVSQSTVEELNKIDITDLPKAGKEREQVVKVRVNQSIFRRIVLATYSNTCCITGLSNPKLLIASHISPWSQNEHNRLNPMNGLALNALHDKAFDAALITVDADTFALRVSDAIRREFATPIIRDYFNAYDGKQINLPKKFLPDRSFLLEHNNRFASIN